MARLFLLLACLLLALVMPAEAQAWSDDPKTPEGWAWVQIKAGRVADFNLRPQCDGKSFDPHDPGSENDRCRQISPQFLADVLTSTRWTSQLPFNGVRLRQACITGSIDLANAEIGPALSIVSSRINGPLLLDNAHLKGELSLDGSVLTKWLSATGMRSERNVDLNNSTFQGDVLLIDSKIADVLAMRSSAFERDVDLDNSTVEGGLGMESSSFLATVDGNSLKVRGHVLMSHAKFAGKVELVKATIDGDLTMTSSSFSKDADFNGVRVANSLFMDEHATFAGQLTLNTATVGGDLTMTSSSFAKVSASAIKVTNSLYLNQGATFAGAVDLSAATIGTLLDMRSSSFKDKLTLAAVTTGLGLYMGSASFADVDAFSMDIKGNLLMDNGATFAGEVNLVDTKVAGNLEMASASFAKSVSADGLDVRGRLVMSEASFDGEVSLEGAKTGYLDLGAATAIRIDLSGSVGSELQLSDLGWRCGSAPGAPSSKDFKGDARGFRHHWVLSDPAWHAACAGKEDALPTLLLRNARFQTFQDSADAWPPRVELEGFRYDSLGGPEGTGKYDMRQRRSREWIDWLARDPTFSPYPYTQLAAVLTAAGRRDTAETILFTGRDRERSEIWADRSNSNPWVWVWHNSPNWLWLSLYSAVAGYGIGLYTFRVLWWVCGLAVLGSVVLWFSPYARTRGVGWRLGASLHRLLPVIELSEEFNDFFDTSKRKPGEPRKLFGWQMTFFVVIGLVGWMLGLLLLAAMAGLASK